MRQTIYAKETNTFRNKSILIEVILDIVCYALILMMASSIFKNIYVDNVWYAILASAIISLLNLTIKPFLVYITLPLTILTLGIFYPVVNIIVLKLASILMSSHFVIEGWFTPFFIAIFISIMKILFEIFIIKPIVER